MQLLKVTPAIAQTYNLKVKNPHPDYEVYLDLDNQKNVYAVLKGIKPTTKIITEINNFHRTKQELLD